MRTPPARVHGRRTMLSVRLNMEGLRTAAERAGVNVPELMEANNLSYEELDGRMAWLVHPRQVKKSVAADAAKRERERVQTIQGIRVFGADMEALKLKLISSGATAGDAALQITAAQAERDRATRADRLSALRGDEAELEAPAPSMSSTTPTSNENQEAEQLAAAVMNAGKPRRKN